MFALQKGAPNLYLNPDASPVQARHECEYCAGARLISDVRHPSKQRTSEKPLA